MRIEFLCKNYTASDKLKDLIEKKVEKLDKFFDEDTKAKVVLKKTKDIATLEITVGIGSGIIRAEVTGDNMYDNIDVAIPKIEKQVVRRHEKLRSKKSKVREVIDFAPIAEEPAEAVKKIVRSKSYVMVPMTEEDAIEEMELVGHDFYVFLNKSTGNINVLYARNDGDYGLIEAVR